MGSVLYFASKQRYATKALPLKGEIKVKDIGSKKMSEISESPEAKLGEMVARTQRAIRSREVDREETVDLVTRAMGSQSRRKFAEDLKVNVSSVSRILNGQVNEINPVLLAKIAFYAAPNSEVTLDKLMEAQGLNDPQDRHLLLSRYEEDCRRIMVDQLLRQGYSVKYESESKIHGRMIADFTLRTNAVSDEEALWLVDCKMTSQYSMIPVGYGRAQLWIDAAMAYYYRGDEAGRISLVVDRREVFEQMKSRMSELSIPNEISVILISIREGRILEEYVAPLSNGKIPHQVFRKTGDTAD